MFLLFSVNITTDKKKKNKEKRPIDSCFFFPISLQSFIILIKYCSQDFCPIFNAFLSCSTWKSFIGYAFSFYLEQEEAPLSVLFVFFISGLKRALLDSNSKEKNKYHQPNSSYVLNCT